MGKNNSIAEKPKGKRRGLRAVLWLILIAALLAAVYIRTNPRWKAAELSVVPANRHFQVESLDPQGMTLETRILPPEGYTRAAAEEGSFGEYLRKYPLLPDDIQLPVYDGSTIDFTDAAAVFDISLGDEGYQQCADSVIRLYSDYFYETGQTDRISFLFSNGDECSYERWKKGRRMLVLAGFSCEIPAALPDDSEQQYRNYLKEVMRYAGTLSLQKESEVIPAAELRTGDIICNDTHVVMIADTAVNDKGEKCYLIGQSYIPSVCFHIITWTQGSTTSPWFTQEQLSGDLSPVLGYGFGQQDIRRWKEGF